MPKNHKKSAESARAHSKQARESVDRHGRDLAKMRKSADDAAENLATSTARQRKREDFSQAAARIVREATENH
jgi:hypothetical protein